MRNARADAVGDAAHPFHEREVALAVLLSEARRVRTAVARIELAVGGEMPADEPARQDAVRGNRDSEFAACRQDRVLDPARDERVLDLQVADRVHDPGAADRLGADLGEADVADVSRVDHFADRADRLLYRHVGVEARRAIDVDVLDAEPG